MNGLPNTTIEAQTKMRQSKDTILLVDDELKAFISNQGGQLLFK